MEKYAGYKIGFSKEQAKQFKKEWSEVTRKIKEQAEKEGIDLSKINLVGIPR